MRYNARFIIVKKKEKNMAIIVGFPRIGAQRELKRALESYWGGKTSVQDLQAVAKELRATHWNHQKNLEYVCVNDFSFYDNMLDMSVALGAIPKRFRALELSGLELYFAMARGAKGVAAQEMTKWFNTNYHYVVPELELGIVHQINADRIKEQYNEAKQLGYKPKISLVGIFTYLALSKFVDSSSFEEHYHAIKKAYIALLKDIATLEPNAKDIVIQCDEPIFVRGHDSRFYHLIEPFYNELKALGFTLFISSYFEECSEALAILAKTNIDGVIVDLVYGSTKGLEHFKGSKKRIFAGLVDGRNIWVTPLAKRLEIAKQLQEQLPSEQISVSSSCSLLHVPYTKANENKLPAQLHAHIAFAIEKIDEILLLESALKGAPANASAWAENERISAERSSAAQSFSLPNVANKRSKPYTERIAIQHKLLNLPPLPTTTIGSFPQNPELRNLRRDFKKGVISEQAYNDGIKDYIRDCVKLQEDVGLDVLVHGEPERNDMVEYFGEQMEGFAFSQNAWVQSYGSRCVKPPIIYANVNRAKPMTVEWITFAQSLTKKPMKGMLTGPVTILNWSFVRDDIPRKLVCMQIAHEIAKEIDDLQNAGVKIIQVDEAAFKEGYPLRREKVADYEQWAGEAFRIATAVAKPETQIHTHMCYSDFNDIMDSIQSLDADVISIECARSGNELLKAFQKVGYKHEVGPGVYDIHSPQIPTTDHIKRQIQAFLEVLPKEQLWINPDCGLKTRKDAEVRPSLKNMVDAVQALR